MSEASIPTLYSLDDYRLEVPSDIRCHLEAQYQGLYNNGEKIDAPEKGTKVKKHVDHIVDKLKTPPPITVVRVNHIVTSTESLISNVERCLSSWTKHITNGAIDGTSLFHIERNKVIKDIIEIHPKHIESDHPSLSACTIPPPSSNGDAHLFQNWPRRIKQKLPLSHKVIICDRKCGEAVLQGSNIFLRGVLAADKSIQFGDEIAVYAHIKQNTQSKDEKLPRGLLVENYCGHCVFLGVGTFRLGSRADIFTLQHGLAVEMNSVSCKNVPLTVGPLHPPYLGCLDKLDGKMMLQTMPSTVVSWALNPQKGETILDMCCAPGGKTSHIASLVNNDAFIVAIDKSRKKMLSVRDFFAKMGATCIVPLALDTTKCVFGHTKNHDLKSGDDRQSAQEVIQNSKPSTKDGLLDVKGFFPESFDKILLDPPCSALGLRPRIHIEYENVESLNNYVNYQRKFIRNAVHLLKPGGTMTFSTCTINSSENESNVKYILEEFPMLKLVPIDLDIGSPGLPLLSDTERMMVRRFDPDDSTDSCGFFVAKFIKQFKV